MNTKLLLVAAVLAVVGITLLFLSQPKAVSPTTPGSGQIDESDYLDDAVADLNQLPEGQTANRSAGLDESDYLDDALADLGSLG